MSATSILRDNILDTRPAAAPVSTRLKVTGQAFRYGEYESNRPPTRTIRSTNEPLQFVVNTECHESLLNSEIEIAVEIRDRVTDETIFETFWVTRLTHTQQQSSFIFRELPQELADLPEGEGYVYYASALVNRTDDFADRTTRAQVR